MKTSQIIITSLLGLTTCSSLVLASIHTYADNDTAVDEVEITVPVACTMTGTIDTNHTATLTPGTYSGTSTDYANGIGKTTLTTFCNDYNGFSIYAIGYTNDEYSNTTLVGQNTGSIIPAKVYESSDTTSNWSMKVNKVNDSAQSFNPSNMFIQNSFDNWHTIPNNYTKVAEYHATAGSSTTDQALGAKVETTYASFISTSQPADTYTGKVKYTMVHPYNASASLAINYNANGLYFDDNPTKTINTVNYDAVATPTAQTVTEYSHGEQYDDEGNYQTYNTPSGNNVVVIDGAASLHIDITFGSPVSGPPSSLYVWAGNHPDYTNANSDTSLTVCGDISAVNGAFSYNGSSAVYHMECDIPSNAVTFYDYSQYTVSTGYYAIVTNTDNVITNYSKNVLSGQYQIPNKSGEQFKFLGWSEDANATTPSYTNQAEISSKAPYSNKDIAVTLYAIWIPAIQNLGSEKCTTNPSIVFDTRDDTKYHVKRLSDGNCWMLDNLALDLNNQTVINSINLTNTNVVDEATLTSLKSGNRAAGAKYATSGLNGYNWTSGSDNSVPRANNQYKDEVSQGSISTGGGFNKDGIYYNFCATSAGSYCYGDTSGSSGTSAGDATEDICPKGWRLPTGKATESGEYYNLYGYYNDATLFRTALSLPLSGIMDSNGVSNRGSYGYWWTSTRGDDGNMYVLNANSSYVNRASGYYGRYRGFSIRCVRNTD